MVLYFMLIFQFNMICNVPLTGIEASSSNHCSHGKAISITYSECVSIAFVTQHEMLLSSVACVAQFFFHIIS